MFVALSLKNRSHMIYTRFVFFVNYAFIQYWSCHPAEKKKMKNDFDKKKKRTNYIGEIIGNPAVQIA